MAISLKQVNFDPRYIESLLLDESELQSSVYATGRELLRSYSRVPDDKIASHVADVVCLYLAPSMAANMLPPRGC